jgi:magnesium chelatase subunit H
MRFIFLTMEVTNNAALRQAVQVLNNQYQLGLELKLHNVSLLRSSDDWDKLKEDIRIADFIFGSMLFSEEVVRPLEDCLHEASCPICIITSNPTLIKQTRLGRFVLNQSESEESSNPFKKLMGRLKPKHGHGESQRQLGIVRNLTKVLKMIPGKAKDIYSFIAAHQYWLNGSDENIVRMLSLFIDQYIEGYKGKLTVKDPLFYPETALYHPDSPTHFESVDQYKKWQASRGKNLTKGRVAILSMRASILGGNTLHLSNLVHSLETKGLEVCIAYSGGLDFRPAIDEFFKTSYTSSSKLSNKNIHIDLLVNATGFSLVGGPAESRPEAAREVLQKLGIAYMEMIPLAFQRISEWQKDPMGLSPVQLALSVAIPELDGATEPRIYGGPGASLERIEPIADEIALAADRIYNRVQLHRKENADKKLAIVLFNFPPNLGNIGTAAYLDVFSSLFRLLKELKQQGYKVELPNSADELRKAIVNGNHNIYGTTGHVQDFLPVSDYKTLFPDYHEIENFWGNAPGDMLNDGERFYILGCSFGNIFIGQQPSFGYERDPMRLLMAKDAAPHHGFAAFYTWLNYSYKADAVLHFGTHGALEFMPGKQNGLSHKCWPTRLLGHLPNIYYYCVNNPSEGTIAKRRSSATIVSYMAPPLEKAGLYKELRQLKDLIDAYKKHPSSELMDDIKTRSASMELLEISQSPEEHPGHSNGNGYHTPSADEKFLTQLTHELLRVEERMIPLGLHELGKSPSLSELCDMLTMITHFATPGAMTKTLPRLISEKKGWNYTYITDHLASDPAAQNQSQTVLDICHSAIKRFINSQECNSTGDGQKNVSFSDILKGSHAIRKSMADDYLHAELNIKPGTLSDLWDYLNPILINLVEDQELKGLCDALNGAYIPPSPGNDVIRNPMVVPTGRNIHSLDPFRMPSDFAQQQARKLVKDLLDQSLNSEGAYPESIAMVLWGTDNLKSDGEGVAQVFELIGAKPKEDELGNISDVELIPLEELKRPRIDVMVTVSGIFRDLLTHQMKLIDKATRLAAKANESKEMNYIRKHALSQSETLNLPIDDVASRVFSNAPGSYGANVNHLVESSTWDDDSQLCDAFISRKCFSLSPEGQWQEKREVFEENLKHVDMAFQNIDSFEIGINDIDHYYEYLGGITKSVEKRRQKKPKVMVADAISTSGERLSSLEKMVKLESRTKTLNPKWYESMLKHGYEGVHEIEAHVSNTYGWSATASAVDDWVYQGIADTYMHDKTMLERLSSLNPHATAGIARRLLEANSRGFWEADEDTIENLKHIYQDLEDRLEKASETI